MDDEQRWQVVVARATDADGAFVYAVKTTGVCCRPSCPARRPRRDNVEFFASVAAAERAGYRPCRRCRPATVAPAAQRAAVVAGWCRWLAEQSAPPTLARLAGFAGLSPWHVQRTFLAVTGTTPRAFVAGLRADRLRDELAAGVSVTAASYRAGFGSASRSQAAAGPALGMAARRYRRGGAKELITFAVAPCTLGWVLAAWTARGLCALLLGDDAEPLRNDLLRRFSRAECCAAEPTAAATMAAVVAFVDGERADPGLPADLRGTLFQQRVWAALQLVPAGTTCSYAELARRLGMPRGARAVASACGANPVALLVPCHRVVAGDGRLAGYRWGIERKRTLLQRERGR